MFVSHDTAFVEVMRRQGSEEPWVTVSARAGQSVRLVSIGCDVAVSSVYVGGAARGL